jgi:hypothetical protein
MVRLRSSGILSLLAELTLTLMSCADSGGMHNETNTHQNRNTGLNHTTTSAVANQTQVQSLEMMHKDAQGVLYCDYMGSIIEAPFQPEEGQVVFDNAMGIRMKWVRGWKRDGHANPNLTQSNPMQIQMQPMQPPGLVNANPMQPLGVASAEFCTKCGHPGEADNVFCANCGHNSAQA